MKFPASTFTFFVIFIISSLALPCFAQSTNQNIQKNSLSFPGGVSELLIDKQSDQLPTVKFGTKEPIIIEQANSWRILIGLSLKTLPGDYLVYVKRATKNSSGFNLKFSVAQQKYSLSDTAITANNIALFRKVYTSFSSIDFSNSEQPSLPLQLPINGRWQDNFGTIYQSNDGETLIRQNLVRYQAIPFTAVQAPQNAIISHIELHDSGTATVYLDHGRGLYSILSGLSDLTVEIGNGVVAGAVLGKMLPINYDQQAQANLTVTPFLNWQVVMNEIYINPLLLTDF